MNSEINTYMLNIFLIGLIALIALMAGIIYWNFRIMSSYSRHKEKLAKLEEKIDSYSTVVNEVKKSVSSYSEFIDALKNHTDSLRDFSKDLHTSMMMNVEIVHLFDTVMNELNLDISEIKARAKQQAKEENNG